MSKVALITGIRRIGFYVAQYLLNNGYELAILYRSSSREAEELKNYALRLNRKVLTFKVDLTDPNTYKDIPQKVYQILGRIDLLLNIASPFGAVDFFETEVETFRKYWTSIVEASFFLSQGVARYMKLNKGTVKGRIINFGDWSTVVGNPYRNFSPYLIAKGGLDTLTEVLAVELAPDILVNEIALGPVLPPMLNDREKTDHWSDYIKEKTLLGRPVNIEDILSAVDFFAKTSSVTGEILILDSGQRFVGKGYRKGKD
jgi:NAD(P)-dependent dehydrogenase (short-subunit alcohol dehydrogenase family)